MPIKADLSAVENVEDRELLEQARSMCREEFPAVVADENGAFVYCNKSAGNIRTRRKISGLYDILNVNKADMKQFLHRKGPFAVRIISRKYVWVLISKFRSSKLCCAYFVIPNGDIYGKFTTLGEYLMYLSALLELTTRFCGENNQSSAELLSVLKTRTTRIMTLCGLYSSMKKVQDPPVIDLSKFILLLSDAARPVLSPFGVSISFVCDRAHPAKLGTENFAKLFSASVNMMIINSADKKIHISCNTSENGGIKLELSTQSAQDESTGFYTDFIADVCGKLGFFTDSGVDDSGVFYFSAQIPEETDCDFFVRTLSIERYMYDVSPYEEIFRLLLCGSDMFCV